LYIHISLKFLAKNQIRVKNMSSSSDLSFPFTSFDKEQTLRHLVEECTNPPLLIEPSSQGCWQRGSKCSFISKLNSQHKINSKHLHDGLEAAQKVWVRTFDEYEKGGFSELNERPKPTSVDMEMEDVLKVGIPMMLFGAVGIEDPNESPLGFSAAPYVEPRAKTLAHRASIVILTTVLQEEISWMKEKRVLAIDYIGRMTESSQSKDKKDDIRALINRFDHLIADGERAIAVKVYDKGL
jgi:hypothetical protein